jgi:hypothetical protein
MTKLHHRKDLEGLEGLDEMQLKMRIEMLEAQLQHRRYFAYTELEKLSERKMYGSAVIVTFSSSSGKEIISSFAITDGFSDNLIEAFRQDIIKTENKANEFKPKAIKEAKE